MEDSVNEAKPLEDAKFKTLKDEISRLQDEISNERNEREVLLL